MAKNKNKNKGNNMVENNDFLPEAEQVIPEDKIEGGEQQEPEVKDSDVEQTEEVEDTQEETKTSEENVPDVVIQEDTTESKEDKAIISQNGFKIDYQEFIINRISTKKTTKADLVNLIAKSASNSVFSSFALVKLPLCAIERIIWSYSFFAKNGWKLYFFLSPAVV